MADKIEIDEADFLAGLYVDMESLNLSSWGKVRLLGLLMNLICKHEGRFVWPDKLAAMFNTIQATQADHQLDRELDDAVFMTHIWELADLKKQFPDQHHDLPKGPQYG